MGNDFDAKSALADILSESKKPPKRGRKKGSKNNLKLDHAPETDPDNLNTRAIAVLRNPISTRDDNWQLVFLREESMQSNI